MGLISQKILQSLLRRRLLKAASEFGLHYFPWRIQMTLVANKIKMIDIHWLSVQLCHLQVTLLAINSALR